MSFKYKNMDPPGRKGLNQNITRGAVLQSHAPTLSWKHWAVERRLQRPKVKAGGRTATNGFLHSFKTNPVFIAYIQLSFGFSKAWFYCCDQAALPNLLYQKHKHVNMIIIIGTRGFGMIFLFSHKLKACGWLGVALSMWVSGKAA